jgi:glycosyltransferase involved in cell wall biosynthesis
VNAPAFLVGLPYPHHARHSGYERFAEHLGERVPAPIERRWIPGRAGMAVDRALARAVGQPNYSVGVLLAEVAAATHMLRRAGSIYHVMYGERDLWLLRPLAGRRGNRLVATFHGPLDVPAAPLSWLDETLDAAILVSEYQRRYFRDLLPPERLFVARYGVDSRFFSPAPEPPAEPVCLVVGSHLRDFGTLAGAMRRVWRAEPEVRFRFVGLRSPDGVTPLLGDPRVEVLPRLSDEELREAYRSSSLALFALRDATASNALLEAMACGLPVVATDVGAVGEYAPADVAVLCPRGDAGALADAALAVLADPARAERMGRASRAAALALDYGLAAASIRRVYGNVLGAAIHSAA